MPEDTIIDYIWWVIPGKLAGMPAPDTSEIQLLQNMGVKAVASLIPDDSLNQHYLSAGLELAWLPFADGSPPTIGQTEKYIDFIDACIEHGKFPIITHCLAGVGRTGTMLATYLMTKQQLTAKQAIRVIRQALPTAIDSTRQEAYLIRFENHKKCSTHRHNEWDYYP